jgi:hypothetical protein
MTGGPLPTSLKLRLMDADPFSHQPNRSSWKLAIEDGPVESHPSDLAAVSGVKMRRVVIAEEHQNRNPVEELIRGMASKYRRGGTRLAPRLTSVGCSIAPPTPEPREAYRSPPLPRGGHHDAIMLV